MDEKQLSLKEDKKIFIPYREDYENEKKLEERRYAHMEMRNEYGKGLYRILKTNVLFLFGVLVIHTINDKALIEAISAEIFLVLHLIGTIRLEIYNRIFAGGVDIRILDTLVCGMILLVILGIHKFVNLKVTMWKFYYVDKGIEYRNADRIIALCIVEYVAILLITLEAWGKIANILGNWVILAGFSLIVFYFKKVQVTYLKKISHAKKEK